MEKSLVQQTDVEEQGTGENIWVGVRVRPLNLAESDSQGGTDD